MWAVVSADILEVECYLQSEVQLMSINRLLRPSRGAMLMMVLVLIVVGSIVAMRMLPNEELIERRVDETELHTSLSQIREAFEMKFIADVAVGGLDAWPNLKTLLATPFPDSSDIDYSIKLQAYYSAVQDMLEDLVTEGYLRSLKMADLTVAPNLWGVDKNSFWRVSDNIATYSKTFAEQWNMDGADAATSTDFLWLPDLDDYPNQNKLGDQLTGGGTALKITK